MLQKVFVVTGNKIKLIGGEAGFQLMGADVMISGNDDPILIEINSAPGMPNINRYNPGYVKQVSKCIYGGCNPIISHLLQGFGVTKLNSKHPSKYYDVIG